MKILIAAAYVIALWAAVSASSQNLPDGCRGNFYGSGEISSPVIEVFSREPLVCAWTLTAEEGRIIRVTFDWFDLRHPNDSLDFYDNGVMVARYKGHVPAHPIVLNGFGALEYRAAFRDPEAGGFGLTFASIPDCGGVVAIPSTIQSPEYPSSYSNNARCVWTFPQKSTDAESELVQLSLTVVDLGTGTDRLEIHDDGARVHTYRSCFDVPHRLLLSRNARIVFAAGVGAQREGFSIGVSGTDCGGQILGQGTAFSPGYPDQYPGLAHCKWTFSTAPGRVVQMEFLHFDLASHTGLTKGDHLHVYRGDDLLHSYNGSHAALSGTPHRIHLGERGMVQFHSDAIFSGRGFSINFTSVECGGDVAESGVISSPDYPRAYPNYMSCTWHLRAQKGQAVHLQFDAIDLNPCCDRLRVYQNQEAVMGYRGYAGPHDLYLVSPATIALTSGFNGMRSGFRAVFKSINRCGGDLSGSGTIESPGYPNPYPGNADCVWKLTASPGKVVVLSFAFLDIALKGDYLAAYQGDTMIKNYTGNAPHPPIHLGESGRLVFRSDARVAAGGFSIVFTSAGCKEHLVGSGTIQSPNYPGFYSDNAICTWSLQANPGKVVLLRFISFELSAKTWDNVTFYQDGKYVVSFIGAGHSHPLMLGNRGSILFTTIVKLAGPGFHMEFESVECGGNMENMGYFESFGYPEPYPDNSRCIWNLRAAAGKMLLLQLSEVDIAKGNDSLQIYDGDKLIVTYQDYYHSHTILLGSTGRVNFTSGLGGRRSGFSVNFTSIACGGNLTGSGTIQPPNYPSPYPFNSRCRWVLRPVSGKLIHLQFVSFELADDVDEISIFRADDQQLQRFTGMSAPKYMTISGRARVVFTSNMEASAGGFHINFISIDA